MGLLSLQVTLPRKKGKPTLQDRERNQKSRLNRFKGQDYFFLIKGQVLLVNQLSSKAKRLH